MGRTIFATVTPSDHLYITETKDDEVTVLLPISEAGSVLRLNPHGCKVIAGTRVEEVSPWIEAKHEETIVVVMEVECSSSSPRHTRFC